MGNDENGSQRTRLATSVLTRAPFVLSRPHGTVTARGAIAAFPSAPEAAEALLTGRATAVVGALPFVVGEPCALIEPEALDRRRDPWTRPVATVSTPPGVLGDLAERDHLDRVWSALDVLRDAEHPLRKVVLARSLSIETAGPVDPVTLLSDLVDGTPAGNGFCVDLSAAGGRCAGRTLVGSSPEVLVRRAGDRVTAHPLAGSAPRSPDPVTDRANGCTLAESSKDRTEHRFVVDALRESLAPLCRDLRIPDAPTLTRTPQLWHLGTPIEGTLRDGSTTALDLALAVHPTPAVCGTPTAAAYDIIAELEGNRGFYGGAVGWCDATGDGEWMVAIRCAEISPDGHTTTAWAGGGIVADSDPDSELRETVTKFGTVLRAFGL